jgi:hypothetical protein
MDLLFLFLPTLFPICHSDCSVTYSLPSRFDSLSFFWTDCVLIRHVVFSGLSAGLPGRGGAVSIIASISDAHIVDVTFIECRSSISGGACYLSTTTTTLDQICAANCSSGSHSHFIDLLAAQIDSRHSLNATTVLAAGWFRAVLTTDATLGVDDGCGSDVSNVNFTGGRVTGEGAVCACEPGSRPITFSSLTVVANVGQSIIRVDQRSSKPRISHSVFVNNSASVALLTANHFGIDVDGSIFAGNSEPVCRLANPSNYFGFAGCAFSGPFPITWAYSPAPNYVYTHTATFVIAGWSSFACAVEQKSAPYRSRSLPVRSRSVGRATRTRTDVAGYASGTVRRERSVTVTIERSMSVPEVRSVTGSSHAGMRTTAVFTMSEWLVTDSGGAGGDGQIGALGLYLGVIGGAAIAGVGAGIGVFFAWRARGAGVDHRPMATEHADDGYVAGQWGREKVAQITNGPPKGEVSIRSIATIPGDDSDELL